MPDYWPWLNTAKGFVINSDYIHTFHSQGNRLVRNFRQIIMSLNKENFQKSHCLWLRGVCPELFVASKYLGFFIHKSPCEAERVRTVPLYQTITTGYREPDNAGWGSTWMSHVRSVWWLNSNNRIDLFCWVVHDRTYWSGVHFSIHILILWRLYTVDIFQLIRYIPVLP